MAKYEFEHCGMGVADMKCAKCGESLVHDHITKDGWLWKNKIPHVLWI